jgi:KDO2-lipid IV(A) lauroyltransferase
VTDRSDQESGLRPRLALLLARLALRFSALLPLQVARALGRRLGKILYLLDRRPRRVTERNIRIAYPHLDAGAQDRLVREVLCESGALVMEMGHVWQKPWQYTKDLILEVEGQELIAAAGAEGRGVIVLGPHLGNWEVLGLHLATLGDLVALFEPPRFATLGELIQKARERSGGKLVPTTARGIAALVRSVRNGGISGILPDQVPDDPRAGVNVPFMGEPAFTATLACNLIQRSGAVALMGAALRIPGGFKVVYRSVDPELYSDDVEQALTALNREVAKLIKGWDSQYLWHYKRYRCQPPGPVDPYIDLMRPRQ